MGLSAQQSRLLTITGRKANNELSLMKLSAQKQLLARDSDYVSNEYEYSLRQSKLVYDYYGEGDKSTALNYGILMRASALNDYTPVFVNDTKGRIVLDRKYAAAARAAGIAPEGITGTTSDYIRNKFVEELGNQSIINTSQEDIIRAIPYKKTAGLGGMPAGDWEVFHESVKKEELIDFLRRNTGSVQNLDDSYTTGEPYKVTNHGTEVSGNTTFTLAELLSGEKQINIIRRSDAVGSSNGSTQASDNQTEVVDNFVNGGVQIVEWMFNEFSGVFYNDNSDLVGVALNYAADELTRLLQTPGREHLQEVGGNVDNANSSTYDAARDTAKDYIGVVSYRNSHNVVDLNDRYCYAGLNLNNLAEAFLTLFASRLQGGTSNPNNPYSVEMGEKSKQKLVTSDAEYKYEVNLGSEFSVENLKQSAFYDIILNQICANGWTENNEVNDSNYLQEMLKGGTMLISRFKDDGTYYLGNYSTDTYIREITDDSLIAKAEAKYNAERSKVDSKERILDQQMRNLETEISALNTEYDTVKTTIDKNVEKSFKRYSA